MQWMNLVLWIWFSHLVRRNWMHHQINHFLILHNHIIEHEFYPRTSQCTCIYCRWYRGNGIVGIPVLASCSCYATPALQHDHIWHARPRRIQHYVCLCYTWRTRWKFCMFYFDGHYRSVDDYQEYLFLCGSLFSRGEDHPWCSFRSWESQTVRTCTTSEFVFLDLCAELTAGS